MCTAKPSPLHPGKVEARLTLASICVLHRKSNKSIAQALRKRQGGGGGQSQQNTTPTRSRLPVPEAPTCCSNEEQAWIIRREQPYNTPKTRHVRATRFGAHAAAVSANKHNPWIHTNKATHTHTQCSARDPKSKSRLEFVNDVSLSCCEREARPMKYPILNQAQLQNPLCLNQTMFILEPMLCIQPSINTLTSSPTSPTHIHPP